MDFAVRQETHDEIRQSFPIRSRIYGWYFRLDELPTGYWQIKGRDRFGNSVSLVGSDPDDVLARAESQAEEVSAAIAI